MSWAEVQVVKDKITNLGYPPKAMRRYNVQAGAGGVVNLYFVPPANTYLSDSKQIPLVEVMGVDIRKSKSPINTKSDGELLARFTGSEMYEYQTTPYVDDDVEIGETYYYRFFPFSTFERYNELDVSMHNVTVTQEGSMLIYGFDQYFNDLNYDTNIVYPSDVANYAYDPMHNTEEDESLNWGGWEHFVKSVLANAPYMVKRDGKADYALDPDDLTMKLNGEPSDWNNEEYLGMPMAWLNRIYKKEWYSNDGGTRHVRFCEGIPIGDNPDDWEAVGFYYDEEETPRTGLWLPMCWSKAYRTVNQTTAEIDFFTNKTSISTADTDYLMEVSNTSIREPLRLMDTSRRFSSTEEGSQSVNFGYSIIPILRDLMWMMCRTSDTANAMENSDRLFYSYVLSPQNSTVKMIDPHTALQFYYKMNFVVNGGTYTNLNNNYTMVSFGGGHYLEVLKENKKNYAAYINSDMNNNDFFPSVHEYFCNDYRTLTDVTIPVNVMPNNGYASIAQYASNSGTIRTNIQNCIKPYALGQPYMNFAVLLSDFSSGVYTSGPSTGIMNSYNNIGRYEYYYNQSNNEKFYSHNMFENAKISSLHVNKDDQRATSQTGISTYISSVKVASYMSPLWSFNNYGYGNNNVGTLTYRLFDLSKWAEFYDITKTFMLEKIYLKYTYYSDNYTPIYNGKQSSNLRIVPSGLGGAANYMHGSAFSWYVNNNKGYALESNMDGSKTGWAIMIMPPYNYVPEAES